MVCDECSRRLGKLVTIDDASLRKGGKIITSTKRKYLSGNLVYLACLGCKGRTEGKNKYCLTCAYTHGLCEMCGKKITNIKMYKFSDVTAKDELRKKKMMERSRIISDKILEEKKMKIRFKKKSSKAIRKNESKVVETGVSEVKCVSEEVKSKPETEENLEEYEEVIKI